MKIKAPQGKTRKQKAYLKWMGLEEPKKASRLKQLNKFNKTRKVPSEFVLMAQRIEGVAI
jgi:hypothetical protein